MEATLKEVPEERDALVWGFGVESFTNKIIYFIQKYETCFQVFLGG